MTRWLPELACLSRRPIVYEDETLAQELGLPPFVRAASSVALVSDRLYVVQDDVNALAIVDPRTATARPVPLPLDGALQRTKGDKADLEASALFPDGRLFLFGSGSGPLRRVALAVELDTLSVSAARADGLFSSLDRALAGVGVSRTNVEGVAVLGEATFFLHRGPSVGSEPANVVVRIPTSAVLAALEHGAETAAAASARPVELGERGGLRVTWTDGAAMYGLGLAFVACTERTSSVTDDGACTGSYLGLIGRDGAATVAQITLGGEPLRDKLEGLALAGARAWAVSDADEVLAPSHLFELPFGAHATPDAHAS